MIFVVVVCLVLYFLALLFIFCYALVQTNLTYNYLKSKKQSQVEPSKPNKLPFITIQLPIYNEPQVVERLLETISALTYPQDQLEIQILDDSTDETSDLIDQKLAEIGGKSLSIQVVRRKHRTHFKAGALKEGLKTAKGDLIAIFDADFLPEKDWLLQVVPYFNDEKTGVVQTRWGHLNRDYSWLTQAQAFALDYHFRIEQVGRSRAGHFINFNGTAGIWRKSCIEDAENWSGDTLTEDLDLSYRAQLKGWKIKYLEDVVAPAELPITVEAAHSQQFRWNKGGAENFQKNMLKIVKTKNLPFGTKVHAFFHLLNSSVFLAISTIALLSVPLLFLPIYYPQFQFAVEWMGFFITSTLLFLFCYWVAYRQNHRGGLTSFLRFLTVFLTFFVIAIGMTLNNAKAVLEGHFGKKSPFIRTPKFNVKTKEDVVISSSSLKAKNKKTYWQAEGFGMLIFGCCILFAVWSEKSTVSVSLLIFHIVLFSGFAYVFLNGFQYFNKNARNRVFL